MIAAFIRICVRCVCFSVFLAVILSVSPVINFVCLFVVTIQSVNFDNIIIRTSIFSLIDEYRSSDNFGSPCICLKKGIH